MSVKITKLAFYPFRPNPDLLFYYATIDTLTFRGIATPELAEDLVAFFANDEGFECAIEERQDGSFKLTQLLSRPTETPLFGNMLTGINLNSWEKQKRNTDDLENPKLGLGVRYSRKVHDPLSPIAKLSVLSGCQLSEVFSPCRVVKEAVGRGMKPGWSIDPS